jgi:hyperosmotically inducible periplasmic protein
MPSTAFGSVAARRSSGYRECVLKPINTIMKNQLRVTVSCLLLAAGLGSAVLVTGCAGTANRESTGEYIDNTAITAKVKAALADDEIVKGREITVESFRGTVQLSGFVSTSEEKARAGRVAASIEGVEDVKNNITVK